MVDNPLADYKWCGVSIILTDGRQISADPEGNAMIYVPADKKIYVLQGGCPNPHNLKFTRPDGLEYLVMHEMTQGGYDGLDLNENSLVIDIGAHVGIVSMTLALQYGCHVEAYEPAPGNYKRLVANIRTNGLRGQVIPHNLAVTSDGREVFIHGDMSVNSGSMSIYKGGLGTPVASTTLADIIGERMVDLLKIDCEGAEHEIFEDLRPLAHVRMVRGEFHDLTGENFHATPEPLIERVRAVVPNIQVTT